MRLPSAHATSIGTVVPIDIMKQIFKKLMEKGIKANDGREGDYIRFVTNHGVSSEDIQYVIKEMKSIIGDD